MWLKSLQLAGSTHLDSFPFGTPLKSRLKKQNTGSMCRDNTHGGAQMFLSGFGAATLEKVVPSM